MAEAPPPALKPSNPRDYRAPEAAALGTLPEGVGLAVGATAPDVALTTAAGDEIKLASVVAKKPTLLVFYRGGW